MEYKRTRCACASAGRHLFHVAVKLGESREVGGGGWFTTPRKFWTLPPQLLPIAQVFPGCLHCTQSAS